MQPEGCCYHKNAIPRIPCSVCSKPNRSASGRCKDHIRGFYSSRYFQKHLKKKRCPVLENF
ncbi:15264_t:CDS:1, partial [Entrophospora sp. SA101]